jgi:bisphosphoglycerate-dependent phosphoglycerate mutase
MQIEQPGTDEIADLEIPTGRPVVYSFDETMRFVEKSVLQA